ncbi:MAG: phage tail tape measure protein [Cytophagia bacterium]|nr:phage tail tape measure protein [Cytophagia bacterium]
MAKTLYTFQADLKELERLNKLFKQTTKELKAMEKNTKTTKKGLEDKKKSVDKLNTSLETTKNKARGVVNATNQVSGAGRNMTNVFKSAAVAIAAAFTVRAIAGGIRGMINVFKEFESRMAAVKAISGATDKQFKELNESALELGRTTVFSAAQVAALQEEYARLGFTTEEIQAAQRATIDLAAATGEDLGSAAATAGSVLRAFGYEASQTQRIVDTMAASFTGSALNLERFSESMKFVAPIARNVGFTVEETTAMMMKLADAGLSGSIAGNALKNIFLDLGNSSSKLSRYLGGPVNSLEDLVVKLQELKEQGFGATQAAELLNKRATPAFLQLINSADGLEKMAFDLAMADGAAKEMAAIRLDTLEGDMVLLQSASEGLGIALTDTFDITFRTIIGTLTGFLQSFAESETALKRFRQGVTLLAGALIFLTTKMAATRAIILLTTIAYRGIATVQAIFTAATNASSFALGRKIVGLKTAASSMTLLGGKTVAVTGWMRAFNLVLKASPIMFAVSAVIMLAGAFTDMGNDIEDSTFKQQRLSQSFTKAKETLGELTEGTHEYRTAVKDLSLRYAQYFKDLDLEILKKEEILALDAKLAGEINKQTGELKSVQLEQLTLVTENYDAMRNSTQKFIVETFAALRDLPATDEVRILLGDIIEIPEDATMDDIFEKYESFIRRLNLIETKGQSGRDAGGNFYSGFEMMEPFEDTVDTEDLQERFNEIIGPGGVLEGLFVKTKEQVNMNSEEIKSIFIGAFDLDRLNQSDLIVEKLIPQIKMIEGLGLDAVAPWEGLPPALSELKRELTALQKELSAVIGDGNEKDTTKVRQDVRAKYMEDLEVFRDMEDTAAQEQEIARTEEFIRNATLLEEYYNIEATEGETAAKQFKAALSDRGEGIDLFIKEFDKARTDMEGNPITIDRTILIEREELERHLSNLIANITKSTKKTQKIEDDSFKLRLNKTKDYYKQLNQLQAKMFEDEMSRQLSQADATLKVKREELSKELELTETNAEEIKRIQDRMVSGKEAGKFLKANKKNFDVLKNLSFDVLKELEKGQKEVIDSITGEKYVLSEVLDEMIKEEQTKGKNNKHFLRLLEFQHQSDIAKIKQQALEQSLRLEQKLISQSNALRLTSVDYFSGNYGLFKKEAEDFYDTEVKLINQNAELVKGLRYEQELSVLGSDLANTMNPEQYSTFFNTLEDMQKELIVNGEVVMKNGSAVMVADFDRQLDYARNVHRQTEGTYADTEVIVQNTNDAIQHIDNQTKSDLMASEQNFQTTKGDLLANEIQMYAGLYTQVFSMFDTFLQNVEERERQSIDDRYDKILEDQDRRMERELEVAEQSGADQEAIRKKYELLTQGAEKQRENEQRNVDRQAFNRKKMNDIASVIMNTAVALARNFAEMNFFAALVNNPVILGLMAAQIGLISAQKFTGAKGGLIPQFAQGGMVYGPSHAQGGVKFNAGGRVVELEGGEAVINKKSTAMFHGQLSDMNVAGGGKSFATGGVTPGTSNALANASSSQDLMSLAETIVTGINSKQVRISESIITDAQHNVSVSEANANLFN